MTTLVLAEHDNAALHPATLHAITAAAQCGGAVHVLIAGAGCQAVAQAAAAIAGVEKVLLADAPHLADRLPENLAAQLRALAAGYTHVIAAATAQGKSVLPRVAALLGVGQISDVTRVLAGDTFERPIYAGNAIATVQTQDTPCVLTVRTTSFAQAAGGGNAAVETIAAVPDGSKARLLSRELAQSARPELTAARVVVAGGRGLGSQDNFRILDPLADRLGAAIGASRAAVDAGFVPNDLQIGQTGKVVAPELYIAVGISGAIQHLAGMTDSRIIVAINQDPDAPIFGVADYGLVGDLFRIVPELVEALDAAKSGLEKAA